MKTEYVIICKKCGVEKPYHEFRSIGGDATECFDCFPTARMIESAAPHLDDFYRAMLPR